jgi:hypothetical protein
MTLEFNRLLQLEYKHTTSSKKNLIYSDESRWDKGREAELASQFFNYAAFPNKVILFWAHI